MLIILIVIIGLSLLILGHEAGHFFVAKLFKLKVDEFGFGFPPRITAWKKGETEYSVNWLPFGGFVRISGERGEFALVPEEKMADGEKKETGIDAVAPADEHRLFYSQPAWKKSLIMLAGVFLNFIFGWFLISATLMIGVPNAVVIGSVEAASPAAQAGIASGDVIKGYTDSQSFINFVNANKGKQIEVGVIRNNKELDFAVTPRADAPANEGALGVELEQAGAPREAFFSSLRDGFLDAGALLWYTLQAFGQLIAQLFVHASLLPGVVGPVGIFGIAEETGKIGLAYLLQFLGIISINLAVVNLLPFPALDGGRFLITIIEKIKGSPIPEKVEGWVNGLGFAFIIVLMVLLTVRDVGNVL